MLQIISRILIRLKSFLLADLSTVIARIERGKGRSNLNSIHLESPYLDNYWATEQSYNLIRQLILQKYYQD